MKQQRKKILAGLLCITVILLMNLAVLPVSAETIQPINEQAVEKMNPVEQNQVMPISGVDSNAPQSGNTNQNEPTASSTRLSIDNENIYDGMDKTYANGYLPTVSGNKVRLVLPLLPDGDIQNEQIKVSLNLGEASSSPFVFQNFNQTIPFAEQDVRGKPEKQKVFLISIELELLEKRFIGRYPVVIQTERQEANGMLQKEDYTLYVTVRDGIDPNAEPTPMPDPPAPAEEQPKPAPKLMIAKSSLSKDSLQAGDTVTATIHFLNTNENQKMTNIKITAESKNEDLIIQGDTSSYYIEEILPKEEAVITLTCRADKRAEAGAKGISFSIEYEGHKATAFTDTENILIPVFQPLRLEYDTPKVPNQVNVGETISVPFNMMNMGLSKVHNIKISIEAAGFLPDSSLFIGNLDSGAAKQSDMYIFITKRTMTELQPEDGEDYGLSTGTILISYEDELGEIFEDTIEFTSQINEMVIQIPEEPEVNPEEEKQRTQWLTSVIIGGLLIAGIVIFLIIQKKRKKKKFEEFSRIDMDSFGDFSSAQDIDSNGKNIESDDSEMEQENPVFDNPEMDDSNDFNNPNTQSEVFNDIDEMVQHVSRAKKKKSK